MSHEKPDCIGAGSYYQLQRPALPDSDAQSTEVDNPPSLPIELHHGEVRFHPHTGEPYYLPAIVSDLHNSDWYVRIRAAWALGRMGDVEGVLPLIEALNDPHKEVRDCAHEALRALDPQDEPLPIRVLLCHTIDDIRRTDILLAIAADRRTSGVITEWRSVKEYCEYLREDDWSIVNDFEKLAVASLKRAVVAVLAELSKRGNSDMLLRASDVHSGPHNNQLLRGSEPGNRPGEVEHLLLPSSKGTVGTEGTRERRKVEGPLS